MGRVVAVANQKGGVGKTPTSLALGSGLADDGASVLLVDLDPQASLTTAAGLEPGDVDTVYTPIARYLRAHEPADLAPYLRPLGDRLDLLPSSIDLAATEMDLLSAGRREYVLAAVLAPARERYDLILIDCPPSLSLLTLNALTAAGEVVIPLQPEYLAARGLELLLNTINRVRKSGLNPTLAITGAILTMVRLPHRT